MQQEIDERAVTIVESEPMHDVRSTGRAVLTYTLSLGTVVLLILVAWGVWSVRQYIPVLGYIALGGAMILILCAIAFPVVALIRFATKADFYEIDTHGAYLRNALGRITALAPLSPSQVTPRAHNITKVTPSEAVPVPTLFDLIESGDICEGMTEMVMGIDENKVLVKEQWPRTFAIVGKGRSGKTRRTIGMVGQALLGMRAHVTICDPHATKRDSLTRELSALGPYLHCFSTPQEILGATREFVNEMEKRVHGESSEAISELDYLPRVLIYDEWSRTMTNDKDLTDEEREEIAGAVRAASREYAGYNGFCCLIGQEWTEDACGGTAIRRAIQAAFVHKVDPDYAKFFIRQRKIYNTTDDLTPRLCYYKNLDGLVRKLTMFGVPDNACVRILELLQQAEQLQGMPQRKQLTMHTQDAQTEPQSGLHSQITEQLAFPYQIPERASYIHPTTLPDDKNELARPFVNNDESSMKPLVKTVEQGAVVHEASQVSGESFIILPQAEPQEKKPYTHEQETTILQAAFQLARENAGRITRSDIMERLGWTRAQWPIIKAVCDTHSIAKQ